MPSFDIVSKVSEQEVDNAFQQAKKEVDQRYDFKGTETVLERATDPKEKGGLKLRSSTEQRLEAAREVLETKLAKRGVSLRAVRRGEVVHLGKNYLQTITFAQGIELEKAKAIVKLIKESKIKVQGAIQGDAVRVTGTKRDDLQAAISLLKREISDLPLGFDNFRA